MERKITVGLVFIGELGVIVYLKERESKKMVKLERGYYREENKQ
ncbi:hypothetical protein [Salipaludibacillus agaradhaerens]|nr:hypothetical protein [Salipaludibacillus agaradhaerens]